MSGEQVLNFPRLDGGLNLSELDYRMDSDQSPDMRNLAWRDGVLSCRDGQVWLWQNTEGTTGYACFSKLFHGAAFFHIGSRICYLPMPEDGNGEMPVTPVTVREGVPRNEGTFFRFADDLYYKNRGAYLRIRSQENGFTAEEVTPYTPIILINTDPRTAAGDEYQSENRLSSQKTVWYTAVEGVRSYRLPVRDLDSVDAVEVDGVVVTDYNADLAEGVVTFDQEPDCHGGTLPNTVHITYTKKNPEAYNSVMDCPYAVTYGGDQNVCVVLGGCSAQPNAYFWSGNHAVMDPGYFPMEQYNLAADSTEAITGFGKQQNLLVIFKEGSVGKAGFETTTMASGRVMLSMPYTRINDSVGCDLPGSIRLIGNNLVFCNTAQGVHMLRDSSAAYENNVICISGKVNGTPSRPGLLAAVRAGGRCAGFDDDSRYWLVSDGEAFVWDYEISACSDPSWFYHTNIHAAAFFRAGNALCHMDSGGNITEFRREFHDYGKPIEKVYQFATQSMGGYDRLKDITGVLFTVRSDTDTIVRVKYLTDYEERYDRTDVAACAWRAAPRNLAYRYLGVHRYAVVARRKPGCRHVRHFTMRLENNELRSDLSIVTAQIFYRYRGRER